MSGRLWAMAQAAARPCAEPRYGERTAANGLGGRFPSECTLKAGGGYPAPTTPDEKGGRLITSRYAITDRVDARFGIPAWSLRLDGGVPDHLAPLFGVVGDELAEFGRGHRRRLNAHISKSRL